MVRWIAAVLLVLVAVLGFVAWRRSTAPPPQPSAAEPSAPDAGGMPPVSTPPAEEPASGPGLVWTVPAGWLTGPARPMRLATYAIGDAECAVFYFGPHQGGSVGDNIARWAGQFAGAPEPKREERTVRGMKLTRVQIDGAFLSPGSDMQSQGIQAGWRMLGAIVEGPQGPVFFKFVGPVGTVKAAAKDFDSLLASLTAH